MKLKSQETETQAEQQAPAAETPAPRKESETPKAVTEKRPVLKYKVAAIADRLEKQYLQGNPDIAVAEAVKALRQAAGE